MMKPLRLALVPIVLLAALNGCAYSSPQQQAENACKIIGPKTMVGGLAGAGGGAAIGGAAGGGRGALIGATAGLLLGAIGGYVADREDCAAAQAALQGQILAAATNAKITWTSRSGHSGQYLVSSDAYADPAGAQCRRANSVAPPGSGDTPQPLIVCRQPDGNYTYAKA